MLRADFVLGLFHSFESAGREKRENRGTHTDDALARDKNRSAEHIGIDLVEHVVFLRNAAGINHAFYLHAMFGHAVQDDSCVERSALYGGEKLVLRRALQIPAEGHPAQIRVDQDRAVAVVPGQAQKASLPGAIMLQPAAQRGYVRTGATSNG